MGRARDELIGRLGGTPLSEEDLSDAELMRRRMEAYAAQGRLPPEIEALRSLLVGYGTLLSRDSLERTVGPSARSKPLIPVVVPDFQRLFNVRPPHYEPSFRHSQEPVEVAAMNAVPREGSHLNGLAFPVTDEELEALDARESVYERVRVPVQAFPQDREVEARGTALGQAFLQDREVESRGTVPVQAFPEDREVEARGTALGQAWLYSASETAAGVFDGAEERWLPHWQDVLLAREGAYGVGEAFGRMFDRTTFMADGVTLVVDHYRGQL